MSTADVLCVGDLNLDLIAFAKGDVKKSAEEHFLSSMHVSPGGGAGNVAIGLRRLAIVSALIARVGRDLFGGYVLKRFATEKVQTKFVQVDQNLPTGMVISLVSSDGERTMYSFRGANANMRWKTSFFKNVRHFDLIHVSGYALLEDPQRDTTHKLIASAKKAGVKISIDIGPEVRYMKASDVQLALKEADILFISYDEALRLSETPGWKSAIDRFLESGASVVAIKSGRRGCYVGTKRQKLHVPAFTTRVVDTTGAGDAFVAGFLLGVLKGWPARRSALAASAVAAIKVGRAGAVNGLPSYTQLLSFLQRRAQ